MINMQTKATELINEISGQLFGKEAIVRLAVTALIAGGHLLIEDLPGVGKTTLAKSLAAASGLDCKRVQFTPDTLPADITGFTMWDEGRKCFRYREGAVMTNILLADEINRTSPRTQSALLQAMEEGEISEEGETIPLRKPFMVIATQNPFGSSGTQPLPDSQLDRFMMKISVGLPDNGELAKIVAERSQNGGREVRAVCGGSDITDIQAQAMETFLSPEAARWIADLICRTHESPLIEQGSSPRGAIALARAAKAAAFIGGRDFVLPEDIAALFADCVAHRLLLSPQAQAEGLDARGVCGRILKELPPPHIGRNRR